MALRRRADVRRGALEKIRRGPFDNAQPSSHRGTSRALLTESGFENRHARDEEAGRISSTTSSRFGGTTSGQVRALVAYRRQRAV